MAHHERPRPLPGTREELLALHRETRQRRNAAAARQRGAHRRHRPDRRIEVEIARIERAMDPPLV